MKWEQLGHTPLLDAAWQLTGMWPCFFFNRYALQRSCGTLRLQTSYEIQLSMKTPSLSYTYLLLYLFLGTVHKRQPGSWEYSLMESPMTHQVAHPIRCLYVSVVTQIRVGCSASTFKVFQPQKQIHIFSRYIFCRWLSRDALNEAYRLQHCLPPPIIPNAEILMASKEFKIGRWKSCHRKAYSYTNRHTITITCHLWVVCIASGSLTECRFIPTYITQRVIRQQYNNAWWMND